VTGRRRAAAALLLVLATAAAACSALPSLGEREEPIGITATFERTANLFVGSEVRVLGLQVGEVTSITPLGDRVEVAMQLDPSRDYPADVAVRLQPVSLLGERFASLEPPYTGGPTLQDGTAVPLERTTIPAEVDEVLRSFENFLASLDSNALADLVDVLADTLEGNGQGLNDLTASGADTIRVLADASVDLNAVVDQLAELNESLATRADRIGATLTGTSEVLRNLQEDRELLVGALVALTRATAELEPLIREQDDPLVRDLEILATALSTVDRNVERLGDAYFGANLLFTGAGRAIEYENARLPLDNESQYLASFIQERLRDRLVGLCLRLDLTDCGQLGDALGQIPDICVPGLCPETGGTPFPEAIGTAIASLSPQSQAAFAEQVEASSEAAAAAPPSAPPPAPPPLPAVDPRLEGRGSTPGDASALPPPEIPSYGGDR
jgi:phospholipid/cholesterol/gamma-HCH transport system substrate-binding protein